MRSVWFRIFVCVCPMLGVCLCLGVCVCVICVLCVCEGLYVRGDSC